jgi:hypothetical protein
MLYRYMSRAELDSVRQSGYLQSLSGMTYFAVHPPGDPFEKQLDVTARLALATLPAWRLGPFPDTALPPMSLGPRTVHPQQLPDGKWVPGGGTEAATTGRSYITWAVQLS